MRSIIMGIILVALFACDRGTKIEYAILSGKIENPADDKIRIRGEGFSQEIAVAENGSFLDTLTLEEGYYTFSHGERTTLYIKPGYVIEISLNTKEFDETMSYAGTGAANNNYLAKKYLLDEELTGKSSEMYSLEETAFVEKVQDIRNELKNSLNSFDGVDDRFQEIESKALEYEYFVKLVNYEGAYAYYTKTEDFSTSDQFKSLISGIDYDNSDDYRLLSSYRNLVQGYFIDYSAIDQNSDTIITVLNNIKGLKSENIKNGLVKPLSTFFLSPSNENLTPLYEGIIAISTDDEFKASVTEKYEKVRNLTKGNPSPKFSYPDPKGQFVSLEDLKGKFVYIDVWATWCGPCIREIPALKEKEEFYKEKNVQFVSVSIDNVRDYEKWKKMIMDKELGGIQLFADGDWSSSLVKDYAIEGIPRFILLGPDGNIINADAPRPSDSRLSELLDELI